MLKNYLKITIRNLYNNKLYSLINVLGLATGLCACLIISVFVYNELNYDNFYPDAERIYRLSPDFAESDSSPERRPAGNVAPLAPLIKRSEINGVEEVARIGGMHGLVSTDEMAFNEDHVRWADPEIFKIFQFEWLQGDPASIFSLPDSVVISTSIARKYFGDVDPLGRTLTLDNQWFLTVTGVFEDIPHNSHLNADLIVPMAAAWKILEFDFEEFNWAFSAFHTYIKLTPDVDIEMVVQRISDTIFSTVNANIRDAFSIHPDTYAITPYQLTDIHLHSGRINEMEDQPGSVATVLIYSAIATCLLLIACINFTNLSTARSSQRAKEIGMRKAIGARRSELIMQFMGESFVLTFFALLIALSLAQMLLPVFAGLINRQLNLTVLLRPEFFLFVVGIALFTAAAAGSYPALFLSKCNPSKALKINSFSAAGGITARNILVVLQFFLAITLIVASVVVYFQMQYARNFDLGFNKDKVMVLWGNHTQGLGAQWSSMKQALNSHPDVLSVTEQDMFPGSVENRPVRYQGGPVDGINMTMKRVGFGFFETYDIDVVAGRAFDEAFATDVFYPPSSVPNGAPLTGNYILNETAVRKFGWTPEQAIGKQFEVSFSADFSLTVSGSIVGVVEDVYIHPLNVPMQPLAFFVPTPMWTATMPTFNIASVRLQGNDLTRTVNDIGALWREFIPEIPFVYHFLDTQFDLLYREKQQQGRLFTLFALLSVSIACLGLFGLASFTVERRKKEIGVRKVMGGSVMNIVLLLTNDFSKLVLIANLLAWPAAYFAMNRWLAYFAYRIDLTPLIFIGSGLVALCVAWVTVGGTAAKAASAKPVLALRYE